MPGYDLENHCAVFTVQAIPEQVVAYVGSVGYTDLQAAIDAAEASGATVYLAADVTVEQTLVVDGKVTIDLSGYTISGVPAEVAAYSVIENKGELTINDAVGGGAIVCDHKLAGSTGYAVNTITNTGKLTINGGVIENKSTASNQIGYAIDNNSTSANAIIVIKGGEVKASGSGYYDGIRQFCNSLTNENSVTVNGGTVSSIWLQNTSDDTDTDVQNTKDVKGAVVITDGTVNALYLEPSSAFEASVSGGTIGTISKFQTAEGRDLSGFISGGTFANDPSEFVAEGYCAKANDDGTYTVSGHTAGEAVKENEVAADCENPGSYDSVVYCSVCDEKLSSQTIPVDALGHTEEEIPGKDATCTETGLTAGVKCSVCGETLTEQTEISSLGHTEGEPETVEEDGKSYLVTKCEVCETELSREEVQTGPEVDESLTFSGHNLELASELSIQWAIASSTVENAEDFYVIFTKTEGYVEETRTMEYRVDKEDMNFVSSNSRYYAKFPYISACDMGVEISAVLYVVYSDGTVRCSNTDVYSVRHYANALMNKYQGSASIADTTTQAYKAMQIAVELLNYGTAAQEAFTYKLDDKVNAHLTEEQKAFAIQECSYESVRNWGEGNDGSEVVFKSSNLQLQAKISSGIRVDITELKTTNLEGLTAVVTNAETGAIIEKIAGEDFRYYSSNQYYIDVIGLKATEMRTVVNIVVYANYGADNQAAVSSTATYSVESFTALANNTGSSSAAVSLALLKYGDAAVKYFAQ